MRNLKSILAAGICLVSLGGLHGQDATPDLKLPNLSSDDAILAKKVKPEVKVPDEINAILPPTGSGTINVVNQRPRNVLLGMSMTGVLHAYGYPQVRVMTIKNWKVWQYKDGYVFFNPQGIVYAASKYDPASKSTK